VLNEEYVEPRRQKTLIIETMHFSQSFNVDILIPEKAINLVQDYE
jgi:hypothetical protein